MVRLARSLAVAVVCASGLLPGAGDGATATAAAKPATHTVDIEGTKFEPETLTVKRGDTVVWVNKDPFPHTATAKGVFDSHSIAPNGSWKYTPRKAGEYVYICTLHPNMKATLKVE
jgi:plastocyanin